MVDVRDGRCSRRACLCRVKGRAEMGAFCRVMGSHYSFEGWLTKSDLRFFNMSHLPMEYGGWISRPQGGCRYSNRMLVELL